MSILKALVKDKRVAYLHLDGVLSEAKTVADTPSTLDLLKRVEKHKIKALVVRINSPGGTVGASQEIFDAMRRLSEEKGVKVVASMGDIAASGGVYVAMAADYVFSQPGTVTGSIGVIIKAGNIRGLLDKLGIQSESIKSGRYKDILSIDKPISDEEREILQATTDDTYHQFIEMVAQRRNLPVEAVQTMADGRIYTGRQALKAGLVDALGSSSEAIQKARELAGLSLEGPARIVRLEKHKAFWKRIVSTSSLMHPTAAAGLHLLEQERAMCGIPLWLMPGQAALD